MKSIITMVACLAATVAGCDPYPSATCGTVTRCTDGDPLVGVRFTPVRDDGTLLGGLEPAFSEPSGKFCWVNGPSKFMALVEKPHYLAQTIAIAEGKENSVCLAPDAGP